MDVSMENGRLVITPANEDEKRALAEWHGAFARSQKPDVFFKEFSEQRASTALILIPSVSARS